MNASGRFLSEGFIEIRKASEHNLKGIDLNVPRNKLVVITGLSGSGKSSLAFDTIYAEGQRRYVESLSTYARQFMGTMEKPEVESIAGLTPTIAISQRSGKATPRSTLATTTEIYDYLRVFFAKAGEPHCHLCGCSIASQSAEDVVDYFLARPNGSRLQIFAPAVRARKGEHREIFRQAARDGFTKVAVNGVLYALEEVPELDKKLAHDVDMLVDRVVVKDDSRQRLTEAVELALKFGGGLVKSLEQTPGDKQWQERMFSSRFACPLHGPVLEEMTPRAFSFNSPFGACEECSGLGYLPELDEDLMVPNPELSLADGALQVWKRCGSGMRSFYPRSVDWLAEVFDISVHTPWEDIEEETRKEIMHGKPDVYEGVIPNLNRRFKQTESEGQKARIGEFMGTHVCPACKGARLKPQILAVTIKGKSISEFTSMTIGEAFDFFSSLELSAEQGAVAEPIKKALGERLGFLSNVGLEYLNLDRATNSLSGGEAQRIRLASQIGSMLAGVTYVLDEPTIGLHQRDNQRLLLTLMALRDGGNTVIVVEHDEEVMRHADYIFDLGPEAGAKGGRLMGEGDYATFIRSGTLTADYLTGKAKIEVPKERRCVDQTDQIELIGCKENNLKNLSVKFPLQKLVCVTGVSGSGKSTLVNGCLLKALRRQLGYAGETTGKFSSIRGSESVFKVRAIDQTPIGKTSRSNPATYTGCFGGIRKVMASVPESKARGYDSGRFSFNVEGGRCEACMGQGLKTIEMHFMSNVHVTCDKCKGQRYNAETLQVKYRGKNIADVLDMDIAEAVDFFVNHPLIHTPLQILSDVGLGYLKLGQSSTTLSGGEAQRIKLATEIAKRNQGLHLYVMDEPTTGLHFHDVKKFLQIIHRMVDQGNTVIVIEHNLDVIKNADWVIDMGPEGGERGGTVVAEGTPETIAENPDSLTGKFIAPLLER